MPAGNVSAYVTQRYLVTKEIALSTRDNGFKLSAGANRDLAAHRIGNIMIIKGIKHEESGHRKINKKVWDKRTLPI